MAAHMEQEQVNNDKIKNNEVQSKNTGSELNRYNWLSHHPKFVEMKCWKLDNETQQFITLIVYLNLCEAKDWWDVKLHPCIELNLAFITGKPQRKESSRIVLPVSADTQLSHERLQKFLHYIKVPQSMATGTETENKKLPLILAIAESGSTIVYYQISNGLVPPSVQPVESVNVRKEYQRKRHRKADSGVLETNLNNETVNGECPLEYKDDFMEEEI